MAKEYIGSQEHFEDEINAYYDQKKQMEREMQNQYEKEMLEQMGRDRCTINHYISKYSDENAITFQIRNKMSKEKQPSDKQQNGNDFWVECNVCKQQLKNWTGSTPCCGSIAYMVEDGKATTKINLFASKGGEPIKPTVIDLGKK